MNVVVWMAASYLLGAIPTSLLVARLFAGVDLRTYGSQNLGATNLYRLLGFKAAVPAGLFDVAKGFVPVLLARGAFDNEGVALLVGVCAILGHVYSPFAGFKGGKGVATAAGVFLALAPKSILVALVVFVATVKISGYVSLGSMLAALVFATATPLFYPDKTMRIVAAAAVFVFIVVTHRANIGRLLNGTENSFKKRGTGAQGHAGTEKHEAAQ